CDRAHGRGLRHRRRRPRPPSARRGLAGLPRRPRRRPGGDAPAPCPRTLRDPGGADAPRRRRGRGRPPRRRGRVQGARPGAARGLLPRRRRSRLDEGVAVKVALADYGAGNLRSVCSALERTGASPTITEDPGELARAPLAIVAGVGNTGAAARGLDERGLAAALLERVRSGRPLLGICVGMQLLFGESEEGGAGLAILPGRVARLRAGRVPHMGWNELRLTASSELLAGLDGEDV